MITQLTLLEVPAAREGWQVCPACPIGDNLWPAASFAAWHDANQRGRPKVPICDSCLFARYPRVYRACATCGGLMHYHSKQSTNKYPQCRSCSRSDKRTCGRCKEDLEGRGEVGGLCLGCYRLTERRIA